MLVVGLELKAVECSICYYLSAYLDTFLFKDQRHTNLMFLYVKLIHVLNMYTRYVQLMDS